MREIAHVSGKTERSLSPFQGEIKESKNVLLAEMITLAASSGVSRMKEQGGRRLGSVFGRKAGMGQALEPGRLKQKLRTALSGFWPLFLKSPEGTGMRTRVPQLAPATES